MSGPARKPARIRHLIGYGVLGQLVFVVSQFAILVALSRLTSVAEVGRYGLASAVVTPVFFMFAFGFLANQAVDVENRHSYREFARLRSLSSLAAIAIVGAIAVALGDRAAGLMIMAFAASRAVDNGSALIYGLFQKYDRMDLVARSLTLRGLLGASVFALALGVTRSPPLALGALTVIWLLIALFHDRRHAERLIRGTPDERPGSTAGMVDIVRVSWPNGANALLAGAQVSAPRFAISSLLGIEALGLFTLVIYAQQASNTLVTAIAHSLLSRLAQYRRDGRRAAFLRVLHGLLGAAAAIGLAAAAIALLVGDPLLAAVFGSSYGDLGGLLALCLIAAVCSAWVLLVQGALTSLRRFMVLLQTRVVALVLAALGSVAGALLAGLEGVIVAMAGAHLAHAALLYALLRREPMPGAMPGATGAG